MQMEDSALKAIVVCADDFGLDSGISQSILHLVEQRRISAVSCMVNGKDWEKSARHLRAFRDEIDIGLHLTLTELTPLTQMFRLAPEGQLPLLGSLLRQTFLRQLDAQEIAYEARQQVEAFVAGIGKPPSHIDGHQHVHVFPVIREAVLTLAAECDSYVRLCTTPWQAQRAGLATPGKAMVINIMARGFNQQLLERQFRHNPQFFGLHAFNPEAPVEPLYRDWLAAADTGCLINCHPSTGLFLEDPLASWRQYEHGFLAGPAWPELLAAQGCRLTRLPYTL